MIGCSHHDAAVEFRERLSFAGETLGETIDVFRNQFPGCELVVLSTCNRVEFYVATANGDGPDPDAILNFIAKQRHLDTAQVKAQMTSRGDADAVEHLFTVAASLDSMVVGEPQILSQVKQAYDLACAHESAGPLTHGVFQSANHAAKRVHQETALAKRRVSIPSVAVGEVVPEVFDDLRKKTVVICGAGEMGTETLRYLKDAGARDIRILNRSDDRAVRLSQEFDARAEKWDALLTQVQEADLLIGTTSSERPILDAASLATLAPKRRGRVLLILDLAVPRDVEPAVAEFDGVYLYSVDDLQAACQRNRDERKKEWPKAKAIVQEETERFMQSVRQRQSGPVIAQLRRQANEIKQNELERLVTKLQLGGTDTGTRKEIEKSFDRLINKILHPPLASLRDDAAEGHRKGLAEALRQLFNLGDEDV